MTKFIKPMTASNVGTSVVGQWKDPAQKCLRLDTRQNKDGTLTRTWMFRARLKGEQILLTLGSLDSLGLADARRAAQRGVEEIGKGMDPRRTALALKAKAPRALLPVSSAVAGTAYQHTVDFLVSEYMLKGKPSNHKKPEDTLRILEKDVLSRWAGRDARSITKLEITDAMLAIASSKVGRGKPVIANRTAKIIRSMWRYGMDQDIVEVNPVPNETAGHPAKERKRTLHDNELIAFLQHPEAARQQRVRHMLRILLMTGQRIGELTEAEWFNIDLKTLIWRIPDPKNDVPHQVPIQPSVVPHFEALRVLSKGSRFVVPNTSGADACQDTHAISQAVYKCQGRFAKIGVKKFTAHDLRRTCRTSLARLGVVKEVAQLNFNHKAESSNDRIYDQWKYFDERREALLKWAAFLDELLAANPVEKKPARVVTRVRPSRIKVRLAAEGAQALGSALPLPVSRGASHSGPQ